ncbi:MAG: mechanosensitive ion channel protein MscS [Bacteroidetes bacterium GWF2_38_335]|nr:MAG: mechanosensitive ion channel protein MscS [Bacteroidetes bacterium GWF2_38_335]OFY77268.1 MAG: mechanosensitive ion channel protein MscS [Bacteroidetes bacterium RIFOXYA12_FULL_38_20]HBS85728.1 mechanosensitive ion channel protein MscS [Bacteroidales bacterium]
MNNVEELLSWLKTIWNFELFNFGDSPFTTKTFLLLVFSIFLLFYLSSKIRKILVKKVFPRYDLDIGVSKSIANIVRYLLIIVGLVIIFQTTGIDLSALGLLVGALGVGIGFGLQNITNNFISGIIILFERPIKVGDRIEIDDLAGNIVEISARATTIITNDNIAVIVPNSDFINSRVINWSHNNKEVRLNFPVGVSYNEDPEKIRRLLQEVAKDNSGVLSSPKPYVLFESYGDSSLNFNLLVWTSEYIDRPKILRSELYYEIFAKFKEHNVEIPFPQRDIHIKSGFDQVIDRIEK